MQRVLAAAAIAAMAWTASAAAKDRVALVIGNGDYAHAPDAQTAVRDAEAVAAALEDAGWDVTRGTDLDRRAMRMVIASFARALDEGEEAVLFYSGHALRTGGETYLAPVDAQAETLTDVLFDGVPLELLLGLADEKAGRAVVFLDGAQLRGFKPTEFVEPGLAALDEREGVMIVSAAAPGRAVRRSRWRDSRFARLIVDKFLLPGSSVRAVAAETKAPTYIRGSVARDFALAEPSGPAGGDSLDAEIELAFWRAVERSGHASDYRAYLERYPEGFFVDIARERLGLKEETGPVSPELDPAAAAEKALNLSRVRKRRIQTYLKTLGFDPRGIDGIFGPGTRTAIKRWQRARGFSATGYLTRLQLGRISSEGEAAIAEARRIEAEKRRIAEAEDNAFWSVTGARGTVHGYRTYLAKYPEGLHAKAARTALSRIAEAEADAATRRERRIYRRAKRLDTAEAYRDYLGAYPEGIYRDEALARLDEIEDAERAEAMRIRYERREAALRLTDRDRLSVERRLRWLGFPIGEPDGVFDTRTRTAIKGFQTSRGLDGTGYLNRRTVLQLVNDTEGAPRGGRVVIDGAEVIEGLIEALSEGKR